MIGALEVMIGALEGMVRKIWGPAASILLQKNFQRPFFGRNGLKAEKLLEKYNGLAKEALLNGDKILSESYYQHADHFLRVVENQNSIQNNLKPCLDNSSIKKNSDNKIIIEDEKNSSSQQSQNIEKI